MEKMTNNEKMTFLNTILTSSLEKLLIEVTKQQCISFPYGRPPTPSPFVNEEDIDVEELLNGSEDLEVNDRSNFNYKYGFNPLIYLSQLILKQHPLTIARRQQEHCDAVQRLTFRCQHAFQQLNTFKQLKNLSKSLQSGIIHGPITTPLTSSSVLFWCRTAVEGDLVIQLSKNSSFNPIQSTTIVHSNGINEPVKYLLDDLSHSTHYYLRCYVKHLQLADSDTLEPSNQTTQNNTNKNKTDKLKSPSVNETEEGDDSTILPSDDKIYGKCQFWTFMTMTETKQMTLNSEKHNNPFYPLEILVLSRYPFFKQKDVEPIQSSPVVSSFWNNSEEKNFDNYLESSSAVSNDQLVDSYGFGLLSKTTSHPIYTCYVGDILTPSFSHLSSSSPSSFSSSSIWNVFAEDLLLSSLTGQYSEQHISSSPLSMGSMFLAWNDSNNASDTILKAEEVIYKQWSYENRKYEKKLKERSEKEKSDSSKSSSKRPLGPPPVLTRPPMTPSFSTIIKDLPVMYTEDNVRHLYRSFCISKEIEVFILDTRNGYLGKEQAKWLKDSLRKSSSLYKLIFTGKSFGMNFVSEFADQSFDELSLGNNDGAAGAGAMGIESAPGTEENNEVNGEENGTTTTTATGIGGEDEGTETEDNLPEDKEGSDDKKKSDENEKKSSRRISSSRQKALEATQEEYDEDGLPKTSLQHVIIHSYHKHYPEGYPQQEQTNEEPGNEENGGGGGDYPDDNSSYNSPVTKERKESSEENYGELPLEDTEVVGMEGDNASEISQCLNSISLYLYGKIIIFSSTNATDSFVSTYSFNDSPPQVPNELSSFTQLASYCLEIGIGMGPSGFDGERCSHRPHKNQVIENLVMKGQRLLFRSIGPSEQTEQTEQTEQAEQMNSNDQKEVIKETPQSNEGNGSSLQVPMLSLKKDVKESDKLMNLYNQSTESSLKTVTEVLSNPLTVSLLLHSDNSLTIKLKCVKNGKTVYQVNVVNSEYNY